MPSPFPGMDPYLEHDSVWHDFHQRIMPAVAARLAEQVRPAYIVKIDDHIYIHEWGDESARPVGRSDISLVHREPTPSVSAPAALAEAPARVRFPQLDVERVSFVEVRDRENMQLITVIELLSPSNKRPGADREAYLSKRGALLESPVHFVELDLLRGGPRLPLVHLPACDYYAIVSRSEERPEAAMWPIMLRDRLPVVPVPLREPDRTARLDLQAALDRVYDEAGYADYIYEHKPQPPLIRDDADWARVAVLRGGA